MLSAIEDGIKKTETTMMNMTAIRKNFFIPIPPLLKYNVYII